MISLHIWISILILLLVIILVITLKLLKWIIRYCKMFKLLTPPDKHLILGSAGPIVLPLFAKKPPLYILTKRYFDYLFNLHIEFEEMGVFWLSWYPVVMAIDPNFIEVILRSPEHTSKGIGYSFLQHWLGLGLLTSTGKKWKTRRKLLTPSFHFKVLNDFLPIMNEHSFHLVEKWNNLKDEVIDLMSWVPFAALDTICETSMGVKINALNNPKSEYVSSVRLANELVFERILYFWYWIDFFYDRTAKGKQYKEAVKILHDFTANVISKRCEEIRKERLLLDKGTPSANLEEKIDLLTPKRRLSFIDILIHSHLDSLNENGSFDFTLQDVREEVDTFMFEGYDTTSVSICWSLFLLGLHPEIQEKIYEELFLLFGNDKERPVEEEDLKNMRYLECCIKESLRLYPSVPLVTRVLGKDIEFKDKLYPNIGSYLIPIFYTHRNPKIFPEPEKFDPSRFFPENCATRHPFAYIPFSGGSRNCIGQKFAMMEMKTYLANILRSFKSTSIGKLEDIPVSLELITKPRAPLKVQLIKR